LPPPAEPPPSSESFLQDITMQVIKTDSAVNFNSFIRGVLGSKWFFCAL
jgi:hypothetical protein